MIGIMGKKTSIQDLVNASDLVHSQDLESTHFAQRTSFQDLVYASDLVHSQDLEITHFAQRNFFQDLKYAPQARQDRLYEYKSYFSRHNKSWKGILRGLSFFPTLRVNPPSSSPLPSAPLRGLSLLCVALDPWLASWVRSRPFRTCEFVYPAECI